MSSFIQENIISEYQKRFEKIGMEAVVSTETVTVHSPFFRKKIGNKIYILNNRELPLFEQTKVKIESQSNVFVVSKDYYQSQNYSRFQTFVGDYLKVESKNFDKENGGAFLPYRLEFVTITPRKKSDD